MPDAHAKLSPSAAERWLSCPASIRMTVEVGVSAQSDSPYAAEGTAAHALGELKAQHFLLKSLSAAAYLSRRAHWRETYHIELDVEAEMEEHTDAYVDVLRERLELYPNSVLLVEQRLDTGVPASWGTSDAVIVSPQHVEIIDLKYGKGIPVEARGNPQLRLYALGALDRYGDLLGETEAIRATVHQPRLDHLLTEEMTPAALRAWREEIIPTAELALTDHAPFGPSASACRFCPASGSCRAQLEHALETDFGLSPDVLDEADLADALDRVEEVKIWLEGLEVAALHRAYSLRRPIPGYKVVKSGGQRKVVDPDGALAELRKRGFNEDEILNNRLKGITELEKLVGKTQFPTVLGPYVKKGEGRPSLAPADDKRPAIDPTSEAIQDFAEEEEPS